MRKPPVLAPVLTYALFIAISLGGGLLIGLNNIPGGWYEALAKPSFTPPNWLFGPAWTFLYILIGIVGAKIYLSKNTGKLMPLWIAQMVLNFAWSPVFFSLHWIEAALAIIAALLITIAAFIWQGRKSHPVAVRLFLPYLLWVTYAAALNGAIVGLN